MTPWPPYRCIKDKPPLQQAIIEAVHEGLHDEEIADYLNYSRYRNREGNRFEYHSIQKIRLKLGLPINRWRSPARKAQWRFEGEVNKMRMEICDRYGRD